MDREKSKAVFTIKAGHQFVEAEAGATVLQALQDAGLYVPALCNGRGTCGKCRIKLVSGELPVTDSDKRAFSKAELAEGLRLACKAVVSGDLEIEIRASDEKKFEILTSYESVGEQAPDTGFRVDHIPSGEIGQSVSECISRACGGKQLPVHLLTPLSDAIHKNPDGSWIRFEQGLHVLVDDEAEAIMDVFSEDPRAFGVAIDIGTTTIALELLDLLTGEKRAAYSLINRQREFGADVISRIVSANEGKLSKLSQSVQRDLLTGLDALVKQAGIDEDNIYKVIIAGNTTMMHLLLGIPCASLGLFPFKCTFTSLGDYPFTDIFKNGAGRVAKACRVVLAPSISAYVGADITSGITFAGERHESGRSVLIDIGTNGEMALFDGDDRRVFCTSTAAGPAFEGGNISCGIGSIPGAISKVRRENGAFSVDTIGGLPPVGLCGSGVMDLVACLIRESLIDETGAFDDGIEDGVEVAPGIVFTQKDVRELQLAKAAIRAGLELLIERGGYTYADIDHVYLAGGFGFRMDLNSAVTIGLIPEALKEKVVSVGNSSLGGVVQGLLNRKLLRKMAEVCENAEEISLSADPKFNEAFMAHMCF